MALQWMKSTLQCALTSAEGRCLLLSGWRLLDFMEVGTRCTASNLDVMHENEAYLCAVR
jgi:hypothetical protein